MSYSNDMVLILLPLNMSFLQECYFRRHLCTRGLGTSTQPGSPRMRGKQPLHTPTEDKQLKECRPFTASGPVSLPAFNVHYRTFAANNFYSQDLHNIIKTGKEKCKIRLGRKNYPQGKNSPSMPLPLRKHTLGLKGGRRV